jgi:hypothetical protein
MLFRQGWIAAGILWANASLNREVIRTVLAHRLHFRHSTPEEGAVRRSERRGAT